jgi:ribosomal protein L37AE/L43A
MSRSSTQFWLLLEKSEDTRISKGIDPYNDKTGRIYQYDSLVPNHKRLNAGDIVIVRKDDMLVGCGKVSSIKTHTALKKHRRCPDCHGTDIRERTTKLPRWKCGKCAKEFKTPVETNARVTSYVASISAFATITDAPSVNSVKMCAYRSKDGIKSQLSILLLDPLRLRKILGRAILPS